MLAKYATHSERSLGRLFQESTEPTASGRNPFQRDRDRIIHSTAFRRLEYKTQVFLNHEGDHFRTRLTHSLEVAQIGRAIARRLQLNEDLVEAVSLAHDLGHTPFGHAGQDALNDCMKNHGGFEHNLQSLWVVDSLEERYACFDGLNLSYETREGILKHCSPSNAKIHSAWLGKLSHRFLNGEQANLDIDDGLRSGLLDIESFSKIQLWAEQRDKVLKLYPTLSGRRLSHEIIRLIIHVLVDDIVTESKTRLEQYAPLNIDDVRKSPPLIGLSPNIKAQVSELKKFLFENLYRHPQVVEVTQEAASQIKFLFNYYLNHPHEIPNEFRQQDVDQAHRRTAHYIAGMTDRFARKEFMRLYR